MTRRTDGSGAYSFVRGATLLAAASLASRLLGGLARIPLTRLLGGEGMGLFQMAYVVYTIAITFAASGLTVATSRLVAEALARRDRGGAGHVLIASLFLGLVTGVGFWFVLDRGAVFVAARFMGDARAAAAVVAIAPAVIPVSLIAVFKGYFQGRQEMAPSSGAQVLEQIVRVSAMVWLVYELQDKGLEEAVSGAAYGTTIGALVALTVLVALFARDRAALARQRPEGRLLPPAGGRSLALSASPGPGGNVGRVLGVALPVTLGAAILPIMDAMQTFIVPGRLQVAGFDPHEATYLYGQLHGMAYPLAGLPAIVASAVAAALIPAIADALERGAWGQVIGRASAALRLTVIFALPATVGLLVLAAPINDMLFGIPEAGIPLAYVSGACLLIAIQQTTAGILQGLGLVRVPLWGLVAGLGVNTGVTYLLTANPALGINGAALGIVAGFLVAAAINLTVVLKRTRVGFDFAGLVIRPGLATGAMGFAVSSAYGWVMTLGAGNTVATIGSVFAGLVVYTLALVIVGGLQPAEIEFLPVVGPKLSRIFSRIGRGK